LRRLQDSRGNLCGFLLEAVPAKAPSDEGVVERPNSADVVADRVVTTLAYRHRAAAPSGEKSLADQVLGDLRGLLVVDDAAPEEVPVVRCQGIDLGSVPAECGRQELAVRDPEIPVEPRLQVSRLTLQFIGKARIIPDRTRQSGTTHLRVVRISLELAGRTRKSGESPIMKEEEIPRVLPALVLQPRRFVATLVRHVAVTLQVGVGVNPVQRSP